MPDVLANITRLEVIDATLGGRHYTCMPCRVEVSVQDDGRTLKLFVYKPCPTCSKDLPWCDCYAASKVQG